MMAFWWLWLFLTIFSSFSSISLQATPPLFFCNESTVSSPEDQLILDSIQWVNYYNETVCYFEPKNATASANTRVRDGRFVFSMEIARQTCTNLSAHMIYVRSGGENENVRLLAMYQNLSIAMGMSRSSIRNRRSLPYTNPYWLNSNDPMATYTVIRRDGWWQSVPDTFEHLRQVRVVCEQRLVGKYGMKNTTTVTTMGPTVAANWDMAMGEMTTVGNGSGQVSWTWMTVVCGIVWALGW